MRFAETLGEVHPILPVAAVEAFRLVAKPQLLKPHEPVHILLGNVLRPLSGLVHEDDAAPPVRLVMDLACGNFNPVAFRDYRSNLAGEVEPHSRIALKKIVNGEHARPFVSRRAPWVGRLARDGVAQSVLRVVAAGDIDAPCGRIAFDDETVTLQFGRIDACGGRPSVRADDYGNLVCRRRGDERNCCAQNLRKEIRHLLRREHRHIRRFRRDYYLYSAGTQREGLRRLRGGL